VRLSEVHVVAAFIDEQGIRKVPEWADPPASSLPGINAA
jgi:hypothetical protein